MTYFPVLERLHVSKYGLYPGSGGDGKFDVDLKPGLTVVLGANGLGKSTLIHLLFRMLTGPFDISLPGGSIGQSEVAEEALGRKRQLAFGARVMDGAESAKATLAYSLGPKRFVVTRRLKDLELEAYTVDDEPGANEKSLKAELLSCTRLNHFGEWIFMLRTMVFFFEDRRQLVWDPAAQRQLLRQLLLTPEQAQEWRALERTILQEDTRMRNLQAALRREEREDEEIKRKTMSAPAVRQALSEAETHRRQLAEAYDKQVSEVEARDALRHRHRFDALRGESELHAAMHELERARLSAVEARFPSSEASMRYIFSRLMSDAVCLVCKTPEQDVKRTQLVQAIDAKRCVVCDSPVQQSGEGVADISDERIASLVERVDVARVALGAAKALLKESAAQYDTLAKTLNKTVEDLADVDEKIETLVRQLPPEEQALRRQNDDLSALKQRIVAIRAQIKTKREEFATSMATYRESIRNFADSIKAQFDESAQGFLLEDSALRWSPARATVGQAGLDGLDPIEYPAFSVEMSGANFEQVVRRDGPEQVSESQREFIDLAFRMALIHVAAPDHAATILIDAPESSLDAVFVQRAANVLARFANRNSLNRLIVTSNLAAGHLIPAMLIEAEADASRRRSRIVDLFEEGVPTRAMRELAEEYEQLRTQLFTQIEAGNERSA